jgi:hypothetical protein
MSALLSRRIVLLALAVGLVGGLIAAVAVPRTTVRRPTQEPAGPPRIGTPLALSKYPDLVRLRVQPGSVRVALRQRDPLGGPDWLIRTFLAERVTPPADRQPGISPILGHDRCAQLGRIVNGRFGWVDGDDVFHPVGFTYAGAPTKCGTRRPDMGGVPLTDGGTLIARPFDPNALLTETYIWGVAGPATRSTRVTIAGRRRSTAVGGDGTFLTLGGPEVHTSDVAMAFTYTNGKHATSSLDPAPQMAALGEVDPDRERIDARAPDPNGGLSWGIASAPRRSDGRICTSQEVRIVGNRAGDVDFILDSLRDPPFACQAARRGADPLRVEGGFGGGIPAFGSDPAPGRVARRTLPTTTAIYATARADVISVTIATPRDVRTVVPAGRSHSIIAVYDGSFPTGSITLTAHLRGGRQHVQRLNFNGVS